MKNRNIRIPVHTDTAKAIRESSGTSGCKRCTNCPNRCKSAAK